MYDKYILGAGVTGLAAGISSRLPIFEADEYPGGICFSYHILPGTRERKLGLPRDKDAFRFEIGGGHWIFGGDPAVLRFIRSISPVRSYTRHSSVYFSKKGLYVPYPLQNHLGYLGRATALKALEEIIGSSRGNARTMADWMEDNFGTTLTELFFAPFHDLYTAGLWKHITPQDNYKSPAAIMEALRGAFKKTPLMGYNTTFIYPTQGLDALCQRIAQKCHINYGKMITKLDVLGREIAFGDGTVTHYNQLVSTLPLNRMMELSGLAVEAKPDPYTSVLVLNIGATRGSRCPKDHWLYIPDALSRFHRVGFYSNIDISFLPVSVRKYGNHVAIYVERAYPGGQKPANADIQEYCAAVVQELNDWGFIERVEVVDPTWIEVAYTWSWPGSIWRREAQRALEAHGIYQVGRFGRWVFQGIADSIRDGFVAGSAIKGGAS